MEPSSRTSAEAWAVYSNNTLRGRVIGRTSLHDPAEAPKRRGNGVQLAVADDVEQAAAPAVGKSRDRSWSNQSRIGTFMVVDIAVVGVGVAASHPSAEGFASDARLSPTIRLHNVICI
jgi:hypothetical protein